MGISRLHLQRFRNIEQAQLEFSSGLNLIVGENGSGKSSVLEAIHYLGLGRSFRSNRAAKVIQHGADDFILFAQLDDQSKVGLQKCRNGETRLKQDGEALRSQAPLSAALPLLLIQPEGYGLVNAGPKLRRAYLDWGVFHVEPHFFALWQQFARALKQRNALLKQARTYNDLAPWDRQFAQYSVAIAQYRQQYLERLLPTLSELVSTFLPEYVFHVKHEQGWSSDEELHEVLARHFLRDKQWGYTQFGAQKGELKLRLNERPALDVLSRGQLKLLVCAMTIAQGMFNYEHLQKRTMYLIDDFAAELDKHKRALLANFLQQSQAQVFVTAIENDSLDGFDLNAGSMFHVKQGCISKQN